MFYCGEKQRGYTLVELMVALAAGAFLLGGVSLAYSAIKGTVLVGKELENAQEVIRYTSKVFTRSIKQTPVTPIVSADGSSITITQPAGVVTCTGSVAAADVNEVYSLDGNNLMCALGALTPERLLTGLASLNFSINNELVTINVKPEQLPAQFGDSVAIELAASNVILEKVYSGE
ncbi:MAG: PilW family protein [Pseudoalteromonas sp.]|uniref:PilW family protein n=1 Tax=unclassified Pseudoalteromonas TaxID=194690 RepID=UPI000C0771CB|nr:MULTISPECIES: prepilin-type N-terminal cleavage/methylation domain-containing protein [unclassified Pseudoalteromonas]MDP2636271.1 prepilin-type N-terminal cleavage/methylation domain-containing protein [Pseudoalteromonas sp. 1_MG-2023]PHN89388.1 prepilin-type cleavage/methylation domain-containing protein [Pseudoalteromonas sp. 3D05]